MIFVIAWKTRNCIPIVTTHQNGKELDKATAHALAQHYNGQSWFWVSVSDEIGRYVSGILSTNNTKAKPAIGFSSSLEKDVQDE